MGTLVLNYYPSCCVGTSNGEEPVLPCIKVLNLSGFHTEKFKVINGVYSPLACFGELRIWHCITKNIPFLNSCFSTSWSHSRNSLNGRTFNETIELPLPYNALYDYNGICFVLSSTYTDNKGVHEQLLAGSNMMLYNSKKLFRQGVYEVELHLLEPRGVRRLEDIEKLIRDPEFDSKPSNMDHMNMILKVNRKHIRNELHETPLDRFTIADAERAIEEAKQTSGRLFLSVKFEFSRNHPSVAIPVVFERLTMSNSPTDTHLDRWNPVDEKYFRMTRSQRTADADRRRKPNKETLDRLKDILELPPAAGLIEADGDLVWQYRFYLAEKYPDMALVKFLLAARWEYPEQVEQAVDLLRHWPTAVSPGHLLELLNRQFVHPAVRRFAVARLQAIKDEVLLLYLSQLIHALCYENWADILSVEVPQETEHAVGTESGLEKRRSPDETETPTAEGFGESLSEPMPTVSACSSPLSQKVPDTANDQPGELFKGEWKEDLATFLIRRAQSTFRFANFFYWFVRLGASNASLPSNSMYSHVLNRFLHALCTGDERRQRWYQNLNRQSKMILSMCALMKSVMDDNGNRTRKIELLKNKLASDEYSHLARMPEPLPLPLDPDIEVVGIDAASANIFKSFRQPALFTFLRTDGSHYRVIFKHGDDLRQDQLVLQMIAVMDDILRKENFDLRLTPYRVLAIGANHGFVEYVESSCLFDILGRGTLLDYLQQQAPSTTGPCGVKKEVMENYIRSCAGYCVITYLLGVGDRHMQNLMLTTEGNLFHIDFGFIFGSDPKPMSPEVRLPQRMIDAMGGTSSSQFDDFFKITYTAFVILRRHANLFLTLFSLLPNADVGSSARGQCRSVEFLKERFCTNQTEEKAFNRFAIRLTESIRAIVPEIVERIHTLMQYIRN